MTESQARQFIRDWNDATIRRNGGIVICPDGELTEETLRQSAAAEAAGRPVRYVTGRADRDAEMAARRGRS